MAPTTSDLLASPIFEVLAGPELKPFYAHASILSRSDTLKALIGGGWKDSVDRQIKLEEWDVETVGRLLEFLYSGDYNSPYPERGSSIVTVADIREEQAAPPQDENRSNHRIADRDADDVFTDNYGHQDASINISNTETLTDSSAQHFGGGLHQRHKPLVESFEVWIRDCGYLPAELNFEAILFTHAKIYCLAGYMLLPGLRALAVRYLKAILEFIEPLVARSPAINNLVAVVRYVYANTSRPQYGEEPLQKLLSMFIATNANGFKDDGGGEVSRLMYEGGDFAMDVWSKASTHMGLLTSTVASLKYEVKKLTPRKKQGYDW